MNNALKGLMVLTLLAAFGAPAFSTEKAPPASDAGAAPAPLLKFSAEQLFNRHLSRSALKLDMGGVPVTVSGLFNRDRKNGFLTLSSPRFKAPLYFNIKGLLDQEIVITLGKVEYRIVVNPSVRGRMASTVSIQPKDAKSAKPGRDFTVGELFEASYEAGEPVVIGGQEFRLYYFQEVQGDLQGQPSEARDFGFLARPKAGVFESYLFPQEGLSAEFQDIDLGGKKAALKLKDGVLELRP